MLFAFENRFLEKEHRVKQDLHIQENNYILFHIHKMAHHTLDNFRKIPFAIYSGSKMHIFLESSSLYFSFHHLYFKYSYQI